MLQFEVKNVSRQKQQQQQNREHLIRVCYMSKIYALASISVATLAAMSAIFVVPMLYTQAQSTQTDLQGLSRGMLSLLILNQIDSYAKESLVVLDHSSSR